MKWNRKFTLTIEGIDGQTVQITNPFTLEFSINRQMLASSNTGSFRVLNLSPDRRAIIYKDAYSTEVFRKLIVAAGYDEGQSVIFNGNVKECKSYRQEGSANVVTEIDGFDSGWAAANAFSSFSVPAFSTQQYAIKLLANDLTKTGRVSLGGISSGFNALYQKGKSFFGNTIQLLRDETKGRVFIDNGKMYCLFDNETVDSDIILISAATGMLGSPRRTETGLVVQSLFEPRLKVGGLVEIISEVNPKFNGQYRVSGFSHHGTISDSVGGKLISTVNLWYLGSTQMVAQTGLFQ